MKGISTAFMLWLGVLSPAPPSMPPGPPFELPESMAGQSILYVGAHPDDEWGVTPILATACIDRGARCHFVVVSEAKSYGCLLTIGLHDADECSRRRRLEMTEAVKLFGGDVEFLGFEDLFYAYTEQGLNHVINDWAKAAGGRRQLIDQVSRILERFRPDMIFTFDPRHGSSCHSGHRAAATILLEAVRQIPPEERPAVWLEQTTDANEAVPDQKAVIEAGGYVGWPDTRGETVWFDANRKLADGRTGFDHVIAERKFHATQVPDEVSGQRVLDPPASARFLPLVRWTDKVEGDYCTPLKLDRPTLDIPANRKRFGIP